ncbi:hypothetical protein METBIDRAFT_81530 [Metschnikowia bicuspidata var. bicuspidata NRRL YB-4993]|uniref:Uncharacterized protein n=1 Tax=Metschnikowia bicuspidata var. bicuspidata NRRL YB-4993 TaxID=869754 RepID=A0A1A0HK89_9ASCO|nr:hypothetical protein METBIDRAFT_81530 [Metschnikowia bicuspidata var. bicuspidata NRRL YB-4993]OBA24218.1 hypothetical protein METBIDRAFT_81530 [Metschnikowia bicuspidata var. bicuspidata NRRL YB-4993]
MLEKPHELPLSFFDAEPPSHYCCQLCDFHCQWGHIVDYNMVVGAVSPNLLLLNLGLIAYALVFRTHAEPCAGPSHGHVRRILWARLGHLLLGLAILAVLVAGAVVWVMAS